MTRPVGGWELNLESAPGAEHLPQFLRIARAVAEDARRGRLAPGQRLPGSRELARTLGVHRNTVLAAYQELMAEGFLDAARGRGTYLKATLPEQQPRRWVRTAVVSEGTPTRPGFAFDPLRMPPTPRAFPRGALTLFGGTPDPRLLPRAALARAYRRALMRKPELMSYGDPRGELSLRSALAEMLRAKRGLRIGADDVLVTRGAQMALALLGKLLFRAGDALAVEQLGYQPAVRALSQGVASLRPIPVDREGLRVDALAALCQRESVRAVYVTPHHQYPTTVTLSPARRMALLSLAARHRFAIVEDDYDHEYHYEGHPILPLASADRHGLVLYVGTLSKVFAPGPRVGYLVAPGSLRDAALGLRIDLDRQGDRVGEQALAELMEDGELQRHVRRTHRIYRARRDHLVAALRSHLGSWLEFEVPNGGMALWANISSELPAQAWLARAEDLGVYTQSGRLFTPEGRALPQVRLGYAPHDEDELTAAVLRLERAAREVLKRPARPARRRT